MYCAKVISSLGLILDIIGIIILFVHDHKEEGKNPFDKPLGGELPEVYKAKKRISATGMILIIAGFLLQLLSNFF